MSCIPIRKYGRRNVEDDCDGHSIGQQYRNDLGYVGIQQTTSRRYRLRVAIKVRAGDKAGVDKLASYFSKSGKAIGFSDYECGNCYQISGMDANIAEERVNSP